MRTTFLYLLFLMIYGYPLITLSQTPVIGSIEMRGTAKTPNSKIEGAVVSLYQDNRKVGEMITPKTGKFSFELPLNGEYKITVEKDGYVKKSILISTTVPEKFTGVAFLPYLFDMRMNPKYFKESNEEEIDAPATKIKWVDDYEDFYFDETYTEKYQAQEDIVRQKAEAKAKSLGLIADPNEAAKLQYEQDLKAEEERKKAKEEELKKKEADLKLKEEERKKQEEQQRILNEKFNNIIAKADAAFKGADYTSAKTLYLEASQTKPDDKYPQKQIALIDQTVAKDVALKDEEKRKLAEAQNKTNEQYNLNISKADELLKNKNYSDALLNYQNALMVKPNEVYPKDKVNELKNLIENEKTALEEKKKADAELKRKQEEELKKNSDQYTSLIVKADDALKKEDFNAAITSYKDALQIKPGEKYPSDQIEKVNKTVANITLEKEKEKQNKEAEIRTVNEEYNALILKADAFLTAKNYEEARKSYQNAKIIKPQESYPDTKIKLMDDEIASIKARDAEKVKKEQEEIQRKAEEKKRLDEKYSSAIAKADAAMKNNDYATSITNYQEAIKLKPDEKYPLKQIETINTVMSKLNSSKLEEQRKREEELRKINEQFNAEIAKADAAFDAKDFENAQKSYQEASKIKPDDSYPKNKLTEVNAAVLKAKAENESRLKTQEEQRRKEEEEKLKSSEKYNGLITKADQAFKIKDFPIAESAYKEAALIKPADPYPQKQLNEISLTLKKLRDQNEEQQRKVEEDKKTANENYNNDISMADAAFSSKDFSASKKYYENALKIKPDEQYPKTKIKEINVELNQIIAEEEAGKRKEEEQKVQNEAEAKKLEANYQNYVTMADDALNKTEYEKAQKSYEDALNIKPSDKYSQKQLEKVRAAMVAQKAQLEARQKAEEERKLQIENEQRAAGEEKKRKEAEALILAKAEQDRIAKEEEERKRNEELAKTLAEEKAAAEILKKQKAADEKKRAEEFEKQRQEEIAKALAEEKRKQEMGEQIRQEAADKRAVKQLEVKQDITNLNKRFKTVDNEHIEIVEDEITEKNRVIFRVTIKKPSGMDDVYQFVKYNWGGTFFFKNNKSITKDVYDLDIARYK